MPPKRKRNDDDASTQTAASKATTRVTRRSAAVASNSQTEASIAQLPAPKKSRTKGTAETQNRAVKGKNASAVADVREGGVTEGRRPPTAITSSPAGSLKIEPYTRQRAQALFVRYADPDDPDVISTDGFERLCKDAGLAMEGALPLILSWQMEAHEMGKITKSEWESSTEALKISSIPPLTLAIGDLEKLLLQGQTQPKDSGAKDSYDRTNYWHYANKPRVAFQKLYMFCFQLVKPSAARVIEMEMSSALWSVLLVPKYPLMADVLEFISEKEGKYRATNKDLWSMMLEFCETVPPTLDNYDESESAWPILLDEFVAWKKAKQQ